MVFDYDFKRQKLSLDEYIKTFTTAEDRYGVMLQALLAQFKKGPRQRHTYTPAGRG